MKCDSGITVEALGQLVSMVTGGCTFTVQDDVLVGGTDVCVEVQTVSFVQLTGQTPSREQTHRFNTEETKFKQKEILLLKQQVNKDSLPSLPHNKSQK